MSAEHGTNSRYTGHGCRCRMCREAHRAYFEDYTRRRKAKWAEHVSDYIEKHITRGMREM